MDFVRELELGISSDKVWRLVRALSGPPKNSSRNEVLICGGRELISDRKKADAFAAHYADVSKLQFTVEDRKSNRVLRQRLNACSQQVGCFPEECADFKILELTLALNRQRLSLPLALSPKLAPGNLG